MALSKDGSVAGNPTSGLMGNSSPRPGISSPYLLQQSGMLPKTPISGFVPGTQKNIMGTQNLNAPNQGLGATSAAGRSDLQGEDYFKNLVSSGTPTEQHAGLIGLSNLKNVKKSTATDAQGNTHTVEYNTDNSKASGSSGTTSGSTSGPTDGTKTNTSTNETSPTVGTTGTERAQAVLNSSNLENNPEYQALARAQNLLVQGQTGEQFAGMGGTNPVGNALGGNYANTFAPQSTANLAGEKGLLNPLLSTAEAGNAAESQRLLSQAQLATQGATSVLGAGAPSSNIIQIDPFTGKPINKDVGGLQDLAKFAGTISGTQSGASGLASDYQTGLATLKAAKGIQGQIADTLNTNPELNSDPVSFLTNLNQYLSEQLGSPAQQQLAQNVSNYIKTLGLDPATAVNIAHQQRGSLAQLLDSLYETAHIKNESKNINGGSTSGSTGANSKRGAF